MPEILYKKLAPILKDTKTIRATPIFLLHGDPYLHKKAQNKILEILLPGKKRDHHCIVMDGGNELLANALAELATFSFFGEGKVVVIQDAGIFEGEQNQEVLADKIEAALAADHLKKASQLLVNLLGQSGYTLDDIDSASENSKLNKLLATFPDQEVVKKMVGYGRQHRLKPVNEPDQGDFLETALQKGFPEGHHLVVSVDSVDRRRKLFKVIKEMGSVIDCSVPKGERKADKEAQQVVLKETLNGILAAHRKSINPAAFGKLCDMTGFDLPTFCHNLEKLVDYVGDKPTIDESDVTAIVDRSRQDPIFAFTNALTHRNAGEALFFLNSLLHQETHPLQVLTAMINQFRKLILAKDFVMGPQGRGWRKGCPYNHFTSAVLPEIQAYDKNLEALMTAWDSELNSSKADEKDASKKKKKRATRSSSSDLRIAKNPNSPYPVYQLMLRTDLFSHEKILASLEKISQADDLLKSSARSPRLVLEEVILFICNSSE